MAEQPIAYEDLNISLVIGRGAVVDAAPEYAKVFINALAGSPLGFVFDNPGHITIAWQVDYEITGYDPSDCTLTLRLDKDWRPGQKDDPAGEPAP